MYEDRTQENIQAEILARMGGDTPVQEGSFYDLVTRGVAYAIARCYGMYGKLLGVAFPTAESGEAVAWRAADYGITRKEGQRAQAVLALTGTAGAQIPAGTACVTLSGLEFDTLDAVTLDADGAGQAAAQAAGVGAQYNVPAGAICRLLTNVQGLATVANPATAEGGMDAESDASLFARLDAFRKRPATSGNLAQYEQWAREVPGVGDAHAIDIWDGPGTVKVVLVDMELLPVTEEVRAACAAYLETARPAGGVAVTVEGAERVTIDVSVQVTLDTSTTLGEVKAALEDGLRAYLRTLTFRATQLIYNRVAYLLLGLPGVADFTGLTVCGGTANIPLGATQVPVLGTVEVTAHAP